MKEKEFKELINEIKEQCGDCEAWSGTDCTRDFYTHGCLKEEKKLTDDTEIDVGMIEQTLERDKTVYVWLLKGSIWKTYSLQKILDLIHRLQSENEELKYAREVASRESKQFVEYATKVNDEQKAEIERLTEENEYLDGCAKQFLADYQKCEIERAEMEEQRDKQAYIAEELVQEKHRWTEQAVKDTAKEIIGDMFKEIKGYENIDIILKRIAERYGVEVE